METQWSKLFGFAAVFLGIILICIVFGGYSSLYRSESRIESAKEFLITACRERSDLIPALLNLEGLNINNKFSEKLKNIKKKADSLTVGDILFGSPMDKEIIKRLETSQNNFTMAINVFLSELDNFSDKAKQKDVAVIKKKFFEAQDKMSFAKIRYNIEVNYFETRTSLFPGFIIAKIFGFDKSAYHKLSEDSFPAAVDVFGSNF